jgi:hypothetical protein
MGRSHDIKLNFSKWVECADKLFQQHYAVTMEDIGFSEDDLRRVWKTDETPDEYVKWYAEKYDLTHRSVYFEQKKSAFEHFLSMKF